MHRHSLHPLPIHPSPVTRSYLSFLNLSYVSFFCIDYLLPGILHFSSLHGFAPPRVLCAVLFARAPLCLVDANLVLPRLKPQLIVVQKMAELGLVR